MKKLFILAMIVLGTSLAQAQDITIKIVTNNNNDKIAIGSNTDALCFDNVTEVRTFVYSWNNTTGELSLNGDVLQTYSSLRRVGTNNFFNSYVNTMYSASTFNAVRGEVAFTADESGQYSINN